MTTATAPIICARQVVRIKALRPYEEPDQVYKWRLGPKTPDGFWMVTKNRNDTSGRLVEWAVRVVIDPAATSTGVRYEDLEDALFGRIDKRAAEDAYLSSIDVVRMVAPDDLTLIRDAVLAGRAGGSTDGAPRKRTRKVASR